MTLHSGEEMKNKKHTERRADAGETGGYAEELAGPLATDDFSFSVCA